MEPTDNTIRKEAGKLSHAQTLEHLTEAIVQSVDVTEMLHPALETIRKYDEQNQSNLFQTLDVYLQNDCNAQHCGRLLFLHRNSLVYRVHRIQDIAQIDLSDPEERSYLRVSFLLWKALHDTPR